MPRPSADQQPFMTTSRDPNRDPGVGLRAATYNIYLGADLTLMFGVRDPEDLIRQALAVRAQLFATDFASRARAIAALLARERVDIVGLQEVARWSRSAPGTAPERAEIWCDFETELQAALEQEGTPYDAHAANANFHGGAATSDDEAMVVLGFNVILVRRGSGIDVTGSATGDYEASHDIVTGMADLVLNIPRSWGWVDATVDGTPFRFVNTHTEAYDAETREAQRDELLAAVGDPGVPVVVVGDFNATPISVGMPPEYADAWLAAGGPTDGGNTCGQAPDLANPESALAERIDYVWVRDVVVTGCRVVGDQPSDRTKPAKLWPSDHACVVADLVL